MPENPRDQVENDRGWSFTIDSDARAEFNKVSVAIQEILELPEPPDRNFVMSILAGFGGTIILYAGEGFNEIRLINEGNGRIVTSNMAEYLRHKFDESVVSAAIEKMILS